MSERKCSVDGCGRKHFGLGGDVIKAGIDAGWVIERALLTPKRGVRHDG